MRLTLLSLFLLAAPVLGLTEYYLDPDVTGGLQDGSESDPWDQLDSGAWSTINTTLASDSVTVYASARQAGSDTNETWTTNVTMDRTDTSSNVFTFNGCAKWNDNDSTPNWDDYVGSSKFHVTSSQPFFMNNNNSPFTTRNWIVIDCVEAEGSTKGIDISNCDNCTLQNSEIYQPPGATNGPALHIDNGAANNFETLWSDNLTVKDNVFHDSFGECAYLNGFKTNTPGGQTGDNALIEGNEFYNCGTRSPQGDGLDIKDGWTDLVVRGNHIHDVDVVGIITDSGGLFEDNFIDGTSSGAPQGCIDFNTDNTDHPTRDGTIVRNNVLLNCGADSVEFRGQGGGPDDYTNTFVLGNTMDSPAVDGLKIDPSNTMTTSITAHANNVNNAGGAALNSNDSLTAHQGNNWFCDGGNCYDDGTSTCTAALITNCEASAIAEDPIFVSGSPTVATDLKLQVTSPCIGNASTTANLTDDYEQTVRGDPIDCGAFEFTSGAEPEAPINIEGVDLLGVDIGE